VVGVMPSGSAHRSPASLTRCGLHGCGVSIAWAQAEMQTISAGLTRQFPDDNG
jgi:hypothetical protein